MIAAPPRHVPTERELIVRCQRFEADALADLFEAHYDDLERYVGALVGDPARTEDIVRQVHARALDGLPLFRRYEAGLGPWLFRIANALLSDHTRNPTPPPAAFGQASEEDRLRSALLNLTPDQLDVVGLRFFAGLPTEVVARATGRRVGQVQALQHRALLALRRELEPPATETPEPA